MQLLRTPRGAAALATVLVLAGCSQADKSPSAKPAPEVSVITAHRESIPITIELPGRTSPFLIAQVHARVDGIVQRRTFQEGADVKAGQLLYQIDPAPYRATLNSAQAAQQKAEANLANASAQLERYKVLVGGNAVSKQVYDNAVAAQQQAAADVAVARAAVDTARINLGYTSVSAPIAGRSNISQVTQGGYVQGGAATLMTTIQQIDPIYVDLQQSSLAGLQLRQALASGQLRRAEQARVSLVLEDGNAYPLAGMLEFSNSTVDQATGSVTVRARFANPDHVLLPGMFVRARVEQGLNDKAIPVPAAAVSHDQQGKATVLVVGTDHKTALRTIDAKTLADGRWLAEAGLSEGEQVVLSGGQKAPPGTLVKIAPAQPRLAAAVAEAK
jgi:membrane fusion protein (multidrug efflux system)